MAQADDSQIFGAPGRRGKEKPQAQTGSKPKTNADQKHQEATNTRGVMVMLHNRQIAFLDRISASIREQSGDSVKRAALIRAMIDAVEEEKVHLILEQARSEQDVKERLIQCLDVKRWDET